MSQGPQAGDLRESLGTPGRRGRRGHVHRAPGHAPARLRRRGLGARADLPGRGRRDERRRSGRALDLRDPVARVQREDPVHRRRRVGRPARGRRRACCTCRARPSPTRRSARAIRALLEEDYAGELPEGYGPGTLPVAGDPQPDGTMRWAGADVVLGPLIDPSSPLSERFELRDLTLVRRVEVEDGRATGVTVEDLRTRRDRASCRPTWWSSPPTRSARRSCCGHPASVPRPSVATSPSTPS